MSGLHIYLFYHHISKTTFLRYLLCFLNLMVSNLIILYLYACVGFLSTAASRVFAVAEQCPSTPTRGQNGPVGVTACTRTGTLTYKYAHILKLSLVWGQLGLVLWSFH